MYLGMWVDYVLDIFFLGNLGCSVKVYFILIDIFNLLVLNLFYILVVGIFIGFYFKFRLLFVWLF